MIGSEELGEQMQMGMTAWRDECEGVSSTGIMAVIAWREEYERSAQQGEHGFDGT